MTGTCYGFEVTSDLDLRFTRRGNGDPLHVHRMEGFETPVGSELFMEFKPTERNPVRAELYKMTEPGLYDLVVDSADRFRIDIQHKRIGVMPGRDPVRTEERLWGFPSLLSFLNRGDLPLHGASVDVGGASLLLCAPGRHGKTSLAAGFHRAGHRILAEDLSCVRLDGSPTAIPGPASLRVRHDMVDALALDDVEFLSEDDDRIHFSVAEHRRGKADPVPLAGIVLLKDDGDAIELTQSNPMDAIRDLWFLSFNFPTSEDRQRCFTALAELCARVPVWNLIRPMRKDALDTTVERIARLADRDA